MEINKVKELVSAFKEAGLTNLSLKCDEFELRLKKEVTVVSANGIGDGQVDSAYQFESGSYSNENIQDDSCGNESHTEENAVHVVSADTKSVSQKSIKAPMVGTFYSASAPGAEPFVKVGDYVKKGDVVCVIEAMKLMNEVEAEVDGEIVEILVQNEDMVEYGQPLFMVR
nr:acetyl-CoA carboxylase biotin carboxyl carrier protein [uncultured Cellulosilyticum sp.]